MSSYNKFVEQMELSSIVGEYAKGIAILENNGIFLQN